MRPWRAGWVLALALGQAACSADARQAFCKLGAEHEVARTTAKDFDAIDLVATEAGAVALWSTAEGLFGQALSAEGVVRGPARRLGVRCQGGFDALFDAGEVAIACLLHPERGKHADSGGVLLHRIDRELRVRSTRKLGSSGAQSEGIALARGARGLELTFQDGSPDSQRVLFTALDAEAPVPVVISDEARSAKTPVLVSFAGRSLVAWAETWLQADELASRVALWDRATGTRTLLPRAHVAAMPQLFGFGDELVLGYRDRKGADKAALHLASYPRSALAGGELPRPSREVRVGRADGVGRPALAPCMAGVVVATPRTYGGDYFVGVNWLDGKLGRSRGEQQFYEDSHAFTQVSALCLGTHALLLIAEFPQLHRTTAALRAVPYRCH